jgi:uncharacterized protein YndB with AHSA1/START domain
MERETVESRKLEYEIVITAPPERTWAAVTSDEFWQKFSGPVESDWRTGSVVSYMLPSGSSYSKGVVLESDFPRLLSHTWPDPAGEQSVEHSQRLTWRMEPQSPTATNVTFVHERMTEKAYQAVRDSWPAILETLKELLESEGA